MQSSLRRLARLIGQIENGLLSLLLIGVIALAFAQIALRNFADISFSWADPLLRVAVLWLGLIGAIIATRENNHIRIDLIPRYLPSAMARPLSRLTDLFSSLICALIAWHSFRFVQEELLIGTIAFNGVPTWIPALILPLGFAIIALRFLVNAILPPTGGERC